MPVAVEVLCKELATVPPTKFELTVVVAVLSVFNRMPYTFAAPVLLFDAVIPPIVLFWTVQLLEPKLKIAIASLADAELDV